MSRTNEKRQKKIDKASKYTGSYAWEDSCGKWRDEPQRTMQTYKHSQKGTTGKRSVKQEGWTQKEVSSKPMSKQTSQKAARGAFKGLAVAGDKIFLRHGIGAAAVATTSAAATPDIGKNVAEFGKLKVLAVDAGAKAGNATAGAMATPVGAQAFANANGAEASASAALIEGVIEANARAVAAEAQAQAGVGLAHLGAYAGASVTTAKVEASVSNIPFAQASAEGPGAGAESGVSWKYAGASAGAHAGEARAGPLAIRAGVKFGAGIRNGVPEVDLGPVTVPCSIM